MSTPGAATETERLRQLELMHAIDHAVLSRWDPVDVAHLAARPLAELVRADRLSIAEHDRGRQGGRVLAIARLDDGAVTEMPDIPYEFVVPEGLRTLREPLLVPDLTDAAETIPWAGHVAAQGLRSAAIFPLVAAGDELVGVVQLVARDPGMLHPARVAMAIEIVTQLAVSIVHARAASELAASRDRLALLHAMDGWIIGRRPVVEIASAALAALRPRLGVGRSSIIELLPDGRSATVLAVDEAFEIPSSRPGRIVPRDDLIPAAIADDPTPVVFTDISTGDADTPAARVMVEHGYHSACWVPMVVDGIILGAMVHTAVDPAPFTSDAIAVAAEVAAQMAIAIRSERERQARDASAGRLAVLHAIDRAGLTAESPEGLAAEILPHVRRLLGADRAVVLRVNLRRSMVERLGADEAADLPPGEELPDRLPLSALLTPAMVAAPDLVAIHDLAAGTQETAEADGGPGGSALLQRGFRSNAYLPLLTDGHLAGAINVAWRQTHGCDDAAELALRQVGDRFAIALARFEARAALEVSRTRLGLLHEVDRGILAATTGSDIARQVAEPLRVLVGARLLGIAEAGLDPTAGGSIVAWAGEGADRVFAEVAKLPATRVLPPALRAQREILTVPDIRQAPGMAGAQATLELGCTVGAVVPLVAEDELVGVISLAGEDQEMLDPDRLAIAREVGDQLAIAIVAARDRKAVADREERLRAILEASPNGILTLDAFGAIQYANPAAHRLFGYQPGTLVAGSVDALIADAGPALGGAPLGRWLSARRISGELAELPAHPLDVDARRRDGSTIPVHVLLAPVATADEPLVIATVVDLSERATFEARLRQAERLEVLGQFAGILAHDVRNYLTAVTMAASFIEGDMSPDDEHREDIETIKRAAQDAVDMTRSVLEFSRPASTARGTTNVAAHLLGARSMLGRILGGRIRLELELPDDLPAAGIDATGLTQVVGNLATNAVDAMPEGGVFSIRGFVHSLLPGDAPTPDRLPPGRYVRLVVGDTGTGMDEETRTRAFDAFFTTKRAGEGRGGTGIGLSSVFLIVTRCGGAIQLASMPGEGTVFTIDLPVAGED